MLKRAQVRTDIEWVLGDLQSAGWVSEFNLIVMTGHAFQAIIEDDELLNFIAAVKRTLVPGGRFAFETRNPRARAWERWTPENAVTVEGPDGTHVRITTEVVAPYDGRTVTFTHSFSGEHPCLPQVSRSTLRFLDIEAIRYLLHNAGMHIEQQFGGFDASPLGPESPEIITFAGC
jgi:hypothetical protein